MSLQAQTGWEGPGPAARQDGPARPNDTPSIDSATRTTLTHHFPHTQLGPVCHGRTMTKTGACPAYVAAWHGMHRLGAALVSGGARSVLLGQGLRAPWLGSPPQGLAPHPLVTTLSSEAHHPPQDSPVGVWHILCVLPLAASGRSFTSCGTCKLQPELHSPPQGGKHSQIFLQQETPESFFFPPAASFHCCLCPISPALGFCPPAILQGAHTTHPLRREGREP